MKPQEKKFLIESLDSIKKKVKELGLKKVKDQTSVHHYGRHDGNDVTKFVEYSDKVVTRTLKEVDGRFEFGDSHLIDNIEEGFAWLKELGFSVVDVVRMDCQEYEYKGGTVGLYTINDDLHSVILFNSSDLYPEIENELGLNQTEVLRVPFNSYLEKIGKAKFINMCD